MKSAVFLLAASAGLLMYTIPARADFITTVSLNAAQETTPGDVSKGTGTLMLDYLSSPTPELMYTLSFTGLTYPAFEAHIHLGMPGQSGAILFDLFDYGNPPNGNAATSGTVSGTLTSFNFMPDTVDGIGTFAQAISAIESDDTYVNIHTYSPAGTLPNYRLGEIRGNITVNAVPEPGTAFLLGSALTLMAAGAFRRMKVRS